MKVLIAEDDPTSRLLLQSALESWGYEPVVTENGRQALDALTVADAPTMAILDWMMPEMQGPEVVRRLRAGEGADASPAYVLLVTARGSMEDVLAGFDAGADDYVTKPFHREELRVRLRVGARMLELRHSLRDRVVELEQALATVNTLHGLLPICCYCKKVRDDQNYWTEVEGYLERTSGAELSHGICPDCYETRIRPDLDKRRRDAGVA